MIERLGMALDAQQGIKLFMQSAQDIDIGARLAKTQYQDTLQDGSIDELSDGSDKMTLVLRALPDLRDVGSDRQAEAPTLPIGIDRAAAPLYRVTPARPTRSMSCSKSRPSCKARSARWTARRFGLPTARSFSVGHRALDRRRRVPLVDLSSRPIAGGDDLLQPRAERGTGGWHALGHGSGSELRQPLGDAIVGGLIVSQMLTLYTTPVICLLLDRTKGLSFSHPMAGERSRTAVVLADEKRPGNFASRCFDERCGAFDGGDLNRRATPASASHGRR